MSVNHGACELGFEDCVRRDVGALLTYQGPETGSAETRNLRGGHVTPTVTWHPFSLEMTTRLIHRLSPTEGT